MSNHSNFNYSNSSSSSRQSLSLLSNYNTDYNVSQSSNINVLHNTDKDDSKQHLSNKNLVHLPSTNQILSRQQQIQNMFSQIGKQIKNLLDCTSYIYLQNNIDYEVRGFHEQIMRILAPPYRNLGFQSEQQEYDQNQQPWQTQMASQTVNKKNREILQNGKKNLNNLNETKIGSNINNGSGNNEQNYQYNYNDHLTQYGNQGNQNGIVYDGDAKQLNNNYINEYNQKQKRLFVGKNPAGVYKKIKQYEESKGVFVKKSMKTLRHIQKFFQNYQQNQARKNDPNKIPKRKVKPKVEEQNDIGNQQQGYKDRDKGSKRGRRVQDWVLQQKIYAWVKENATKGQAIRKVDIRNKFKQMSGGRFSGSTGWCRRFIQRHPQIKIWFKRAKVYSNSKTQSPFQLMTDNLSQGGQQNWIRPKNEEQNNNKLKSEQNFSDVDEAEYYDQKYCTQINQFSRLENEVNEKKEMYHKNQNREIDRAKLHVMKQIQQMKKRKSHILKL